MDRMDNRQLQEVNSNEEVLVTNAAIKGTDVLALIGAGAFALAGIGCLWGVAKKNKQQKAYDDYEARIIANIIAEGGSEAEIENARQILRKFK